MCLWGVGVAMLRCEWRKEQLGACYCNGWSVSSGSLLERAVRRSCLTYAPPQRGSGCVRQLHALPVAMFPEYWLLTALRVRLLTAAVNNSASARPSSARTNSIAIERVDVRSRVPPTVSLQHMSHACVRTELCAVGPCSSSTTACGGVSAGG